jgi:gluconolactonase
MVDVSLSAAAPTPPRVLCTGLRFPEGPSLDAGGNVYVTEIAGGCVTRVDPTGRKETFAVLGGGPNGSAFGPDGWLYVANNGGLAFSEGRPRGSAADNSGGRIERISPDGRVETLYTECDGRPLIAPNDLAFDAHGGFYVTDSHHGTRQSRPFGQIYYCDPGRRSIQLVEDGLLLPNGIAVSPDGQSLLVAETIPRLLIRYRIERPGIVGGRQEVARLPEGCLPDGIAMDTRGNVLCAGLGLGLVVAIDRAGTTISTIKMDDTDPTNLAFGGPDLKTVYVTEGVLGRVVMISWPTQGALVPGDPGHAEWKSDSE